MAHRVRNAILAAALALVALAAVAVPALGARGMEVGLQDDHLFVTDGGLHRQRALDYADELHATRIRANVIWASVTNPNRRHRPSKRRYDFTSYDYLVNAAAAHGIKVELTLTGPAPAWATGNHHRGNYKPSIRWWKEFVSAAVKHFKGHVGIYSIWNEPNYYSWLAPNKRAPGIYRSLFREGYRIIKATDPKAKVLFGETAPYAIFGRAKAPLKFLRQVVRHHHLRADGYAHHPYDFKHKPTHRYHGRDNVTMGTLYRLTRQLDKLKRSKALRTPSGKALDLYLTEYGYKAHGKYHLKDKTRARYLPKGFDIALHNRRVRQVIQYLLAKPPRYARFFDTSIVGGSGKRSRTYRALAKWSKKAANAKRIALPGTPDPNYSPR